MIVRCPDCGASSSIDVVKHVCDVCGQSRIIVLPVAGEQTNIILDRLYIGITDCINTLKGELEKIDILRKIEDTGQSPV